jgi:hypothetical protein
MSGVAGEKIRETRIARATGTEVKLVDADHPECTDYDSAEGGRWVTECADHGSFVQHETWKLARSHLGHPEDWCDTCQGKPTAENPSGGGFSEEERARARATRRRKAEERRAEQNEETARRHAKRNLEQQRMDWTVHEPMVERVYLPEEKEAHEAAHDRMIAAKEAARKAKTGRRQAEASLSSLPTAKTKREKANRKRIEDEAAALDDVVVAQEDAARIAEQEKSQTARLAFLRGCVVRGWKIKHVHGTGWYWVIEKGGERIRIPDDYFADPDPATFRRAEELPEGMEVQGDD